MEDKKLQSIRDEKTGLLVLSTAEGEFVGTIGSVRGLARAGIIEPGSFIDRSKFMFINVAGEIEKGVFYTTEEEALKVIDEKKE